MNIEELKRLAEAATPGPWMRLFGDRLIYDRLSDGCRGNPIVGVDWPGGYGFNANLDYIAAANPAAILELIQQRDELLVALKDARELVDGWGAYASNYMQEKHDLAGDLDRLDAAITKGEK